jgi:hypothetical protein
MKHDITILWGESPQHDAEPITYEFDTYHELKAFVMGIREAEGWNGWEEVEQEDV